MSPVVSFVRSIYAILSAPTHLSALCRSSECDMCMTVGSPQSARSRVGAVTASGQLRRSLERLIAWSEVRFGALVDEAEPADAERQRVERILLEAHAPDYWFAASRDGNREAHYRGASFSCSEWLAWAATEGLHWGCN